MAKFMIALALMAVFALTTEGSPVLGLLGNGGAAAGGLAQGVLGLAGQAGAGVGVNAKVDGVGEVGTGAGAGVGAQAIAEVAGQAAGAAQGLGAGQLGR